MCLNYINIKKSKNPYNIKSAFIPCGWCEECRQHQKNEWTTRLKAEIEEYHTNMGYNVGFLTMTYQDKCLPHIPKSYFKEGEYEKIPCFSYKDIKNFTDRIRGHLWRQYNMKDGFRYFITSEYGEKTHRPHYHGIILFNNKIDHKTMWEICQDAWSGTTHQIKNNKKRNTRRTFLGQIGDLNKFIPKDNYKCGAYVAKYVCKDIEFHKVTSNKFNHLNKKKRNELRHFQPFHKQSLGFGACIIKGKTNEQLLQMYNEGIQFTGNPKMIELPVYIKNKILFTTQKLYNLNTHKFETIKKYTKFFYKNKKAIYDKKINAAKTILKQFSTKEYWQIHKIQGQFNDRAYNSCNCILNNCDINELARFYTLYFGVKYENCKWMDKPEDILFARYNPAADLSRLDTIPYDYYEYYTNCIGWLLDSTKLTDSTERNESQELYDQIKAFFNNYK